MKILITGAAGFIGSTIAKELQNEELLLIDNLSHGYIDNLNDLSILLRIDDAINIDKWNFKPDVILHFAGISSLPECEANPHKAFMNNVATTSKILEFAKNNNVKKVIFSSTSAVYENNNGTLKEDNFVSPDLIYSNSKYICEQLCKSYIKNYNMNIIICRFFNVFGAHQDFKRKNPPFTSYLVKCAIEDSVAIIYNLNNEIKRNYIYVDDLIFILKKLIYAKEVFTDKIFNLCSDYHYGTIDIIDSLNKVICNSIKIDVGDPMLFWDKYENITLSKERIKKEIFKNSIGSNELIKKYNLAPEKFINMEDGLKMIYEYQKDNK